jgi:hypothetical protein
MFAFRAYLKFKNVLNHPVTADGVKLEQTRSSCTSSRVKLFSQYRTRTVQANSDIFLTQVQALSRFIGAHFFTSRNIRTRRYSSGDSRIALSNITRNSTLRTLL